MAECPKCNTPMQKAIVMDDESVAVTVSRHIKKGCYHCGSRDGAKLEPPYGDFTISLWECHHCNKLSLIVDNDVEKCPVAFGSDTKETWVPEILR